MSDWRPRMRKAVRHLADQLAGIRPSTLSVGFVESFRVSLERNSVAIVRMAGVVSQGDRTVVTPFDPANVPAVVEELTGAKLNAYALNPRAVTVSVPPASGEQKAETSRHLRKLVEEAKVARQQEDGDDEHVRWVVAARLRGTL
jgi:ribosome recycling factor